MAPATPKDRVQLLRKAFNETLKDPEFIADAKRSRLDTDPLTGEEIEKIVLQLFKIEPDMVSQLKEILK
jgi:tripartite-type tricarboxylate transporter receptor subunit TctC